MIFFHADEQRIVIFSKFVTEILSIFRKIQIIMTLSVPDKAKVNAESYVELCYPDQLKNASLFYRLVSFPSRTMRMR